MSEWIKFVEVNLRDGRKTKVWAVLTADGHSHLGDVAWFSSWRKYCFFPDQATFDAGCMRTVADFCELQTTAHKTRGRAIDHIDGDVCNNSIENFRIVTTKENRG